MPRSCGALVAAGFAAAVAVAQIIEQAARLRAAQRCRALEPSHGGAVIATDHPAVQEKPRERDHRLLLIKLCEPTPASGNAPQLGYRGRGSAYGSTAMEFSQSEGEQG